MTEHPPRLGLTMGDPAGIGPEIILKALEGLGATGRRGRARAVVFGTRAASRRAARGLGLAIEFATDDEPALAEGARWSRRRAARRADRARRARSAEAGRLAFAAIERAVQRAMAGEIDAIVTAPIYKEALNLAGYAYAGHTDILADLTGSRDSCMLLAHDSLRVAHVSTHVALAKVPTLITPERLTPRARADPQALHRFGIEQPRIAVAALNPHAGEGGLFGAEDADVIAPAVEAFRRQRA